MMGQDNFNFVQPGQAPVMQNPMDFLKSLGSYNGDGDNSFASDFMTTLDNPYISNQTAGFSGLPGTTNTGEGFELGNFMDSLSKYGDLTKGLGSLFGAYNGFQNTKLAKKQFDFTKGATNRNLANQATITNESLRRRQASRNAFSGGNRASVSVDGSPIG